MVDELTCVADIHTWENGGQRSWARTFSTALPDLPTDICAEKADLPEIVRIYIDERYPTAALKDIGPVLGALRVIKSPFEISVMKQAVEITGAMMTAARRSLTISAKECETTLAVVEAGTRRAAGFLTASGWERFISPIIHNLQILPSGKNASMIHRRASIKEYERFDPVYFCFCNMTQFKQYKLGFDRMSNIADINDAVARVQQAAIAAILPCAQAQDVAIAVNAVYAERGYETGHRTGRSIGVGYLESPKLKADDETFLQPGTIFAGNGGNSIDGVTARQIGDSIVETETGGEYLTECPRQLPVTDS